jgi:hypothetical protein
MCLKSVLYVIFCVACDFMFVYFFISVIFIFFWKRVKNVGTVELNVQPMLTNAGHISSTATWPRRT